jgi:hypothetical protein
MKKITLLLIALGLGTMTFNAKAADTNLVTLTLIGAVQKPAVVTTNIAAGITNQITITTNLILTSAGLLKQIAADQSLTLPVGAKLGLVNGQFVVLSKTNTVFATVTVMTYSAGAPIGRDTFLQTKKTELARNQDAQVATISYSGSSLSFSVNMLVSDTALAADNYVTGLQTDSFTGYGFGYGTVGSSSMILKGFIIGSGRGTYVVP